MTQVRITSVCPLCLIAPCIIALVLATAHVIGQDDLEPTIILESLDLKCGSTSPRSSNLLVAVPMILALCWAVLEYAQLVLMLITYPEVVRSCYEQRCSATQIKEKPAPCHDDQAQGAKPAEHQPFHLVPNDSISTNMPVTPPQLSDDVDRVKLEPEHECITTTQSSGFCKEENYLVAMEDDVRKPSCIVTHDLNQAQQHTVAGTDSRKSSPITPVGGTKPLVEIKGEGELGRAGMEHQFKDDLLSAADRTTTVVL